MRIEKNLQPFHKHIHKALQALHLSKRLFSFFVLNANFAMKLAIRDMPTTRLKVRRGVDST